MVVSKDFFLPPRPIHVRYIVMQNAAKKVDLPKTPLHDCRHVLLPLCTVHPNLFPPYAYCTKQTMCQRDPNRRTRMLM